MVILPVPSTRQVWRPYHLVGHRARPLSKIRSHQPLAEHHWASEKGSNHRASNGPRPGRRSPRQGTLSMTTTRLLTDFRTLPLEFFSFRGERPGGNLLERRRAQDQRLDEFQSCVASALPSNRGTQSLKDGPPVIALQTKTSGATPGAPFPTASQTCLLMISLVLAFLLVPGAGIEPAPPFRETGF